MKVLVTGATGFIGNYVVQSLLENEYEVIATSSNKKKALKYSWFKDVTYIEFSLSDFDDSINYYSFFQFPDKLIHLAWEGLPNYKSSFHIDENLPRHYSLLKNIISNGLTDLTVTGTCLEYGMQEGCLVEDMPAKPANPYAEAKNSLRESLTVLQNQVAFALKWVRLFYMYGKGQNPNSLFSQIDRALLHGDPVFNMSGGEQVRDYLPVEKVGEYIVKIALQNRVTGIINCCSGEPVTVKKMVENYLKQKQGSISLNTGYYPYTDYEPMNFWGDNTKLKSILSNG
ncbi:MAG TPA: NAD(P)-dependent oxidoreductase [Ferruginibacter sp.]|nr:NAD(P)-dependent oxidoreductase [Ferruginibacter sp.]